MKQMAPLELGLPVIDSAVMQRFYEQAFGCEEVRRAAIPKALSEAIAAAPEGYENIWLQFPGGEIVKLMHPTPPPARTATRRYAAERTGFAFFTLYCDDIADGVARAEAAGAKILSDPSLYGPDQPVRLAFLEDPEGNRFELVQR